MPGPFVDFVLGSEDVSRLRFGVSPGHELCAGVAAIQAPGGAPLQWGWLRESTARVPAKPWQTLTTIVPPSGYFPDFLTTPSTWDLTPEAELEALRRAPLPQVVADLTKVLSKAEGARRERLEDMLRDPTAARARIADAWEVVWDQVLAPYWPALRRLLEADIARRARQMGTQGIEQMVDGLHDRVSWRDGSVQVQMRIWSETVQCQGTGLLLVPSALSAPWCSVVIDPPALPTLYYPAAGMSERWPGGDRDRGAGLRELLGVGRGAVLLSLDVPRTTSEVAEACSVAVSTASHHLAVLRRAGLVEALRTGASVTHVRTPVAETLLGA